MKRSCLCFIFLLVMLDDSYGQKAQDDNYLSWSATRRLSAHDFTNRSGALQNASSYGQFSMQYQSNGFGSRKKNLNKQVHNYFLKSASWIDTSFDVSISLRYQQTLFDICEIYTRQFRKALAENRKKAVRDHEWINQLNAKAMTDFANRRLEYDMETRSGRDAVKQREWETQIQKELDELKEFSAE